MVQFQFGDITIRLEDAGSLVISPDNARHLWQKFETPQDFRNTLARSRRWEDLVAAVRSTRLEDPKKFGEEVPNPAGKEGGILR